MLQLPRMLSDAFSTLTWRGVAHRRQGQRTRKLRCRVASKALRLGRRGDRPRPGCPTPHTTHTGAPLPRTPASAWPRSRTRRGWGSRLAPPPSRPRDQAGPAARSSRAARRTCRCTRIVAPAQFSPKTRGRTSRGAALLWAVWRPSCGTTQPTHPYTSLQPHDVLQG